MAARTRGPARATRRAVAVWRAPARRGDRWGRPQLSPAPHDARGGRGGGTGAARSHAGAGALPPRTRVHSKAAHSSHAHAGTRTCRHTRMHARMHAPKDWAPRTCMAHAHARPRTQPASPRQRTRALGPSTLRSCAACVHDGGGAPPPFFFWFVFCGVFAREMRRGENRGRRGARPQARCEGDATSQRSPAWRRATEAEAEAATKEAAAKEAAAKEVKEQEAAASKAAVGVAAATAQKRELAQSARAHAPSEHARVHARPRARLTSAMGKQRAFTLRPPRHCHSQNALPEARWARRRARGNGSAAVSSPALTTLTGRWPR